MPVGSVDLIGAIPHRPLFGGACGRFPRRSAPHFHRPAPPRVGLDPLAQGQPTPAPRGQLISIPGLADFKRTLNRARTDDAGYGLRRAAGLRTREEGLTRRRGDLTGQKARALGLHRATV
jgi:hypothetical protein